LLGAGVLLEAVRIPAVQEVCVPWRQKYLDVEDFMEACVYVQCARKELVFSLFAISDETLDEGWDSAEDFKCILDAWSAARAQLPRDDAEFVDCVEFRNR